jgi:carbamoyl-phosphate synthase large subunit
MAKRTDINSILILGAGPIIIGQACEFDYSGVQACRALKAEGYRIILVNSNPATIMTDPELADATYIEPVQWQTVAQIIATERPSALLPTMGGQTALNCALDLARQGVLERYGVELIGASQQAIDQAEDREKFRKAMQEMGLNVARSAIAHSLEEALQVQVSIGFPTIIRPSFTLGGSGGGIAYNTEEFIEICERGLDLSPTRELLIEESLLGWKEFEMEVVRDCQDNCMIVCSIENIDPMGVHTGDSVTVAPALTLTDKEYQAMRDASIAVLRKIGVATGGSNVQFAVDPQTGKLVVIEMNPRVSRSSALASKATGFPIAKIAAKLAVGYTLYELANDMTGGILPASFEPTLDYIVTKIPRFNFEKFPGADNNLTTQMKSVGEVMGIGRTFQESFQKALRSLETGLEGLRSVCSITIPEIHDLAELKTVQEEIQQALQKPTPDRLLWVADAFRAGLALVEINRLTQIDPWFLGQIQELIDAEIALRQQGSLVGIDAVWMRDLKSRGFSDRYLADILKVDLADVRNHRHALGVRPVYKHVDTCAAEFLSKTNYLYSTYDETSEVVVSDQKKLMVLGSGPNRIGQGIEFDYCCVHAAQAFHEAGFETLMVNCNPETVSTDYDVADKLYFEPLTLEDVLEIAFVEAPMGVLVQYGGQTPLKLARDLEALGVPILGTLPDQIDLAEDRGRFKALLNRLGLRQPQNAMVTDIDSAVHVADALGYPLVVRPSYVLGGRGMEIVHQAPELRAYLTQACLAGEDTRSILLDRFVDDAIEVDVDAVSDGVRTCVIAVMEHIEEAGIHSGDSTCCLPPYRLSLALQTEIHRQMCLLSRELCVVGLVNAQFAVQGEKIFVLEVNPRASRTIPFVSKATGIAWAKVGARCMLGQDLDLQRIYEVAYSPFYAVKMPVFPFHKFQNTDPILGPEMKSTGEVMGMGLSFPEAFAKAMKASGMGVLRRRFALLSVRDTDKSPVIVVARGLLDLGFELRGTRGTAAALMAAGIACVAVNKVTEGRPHIVDMIKNDEIDFIVNTTSGRQAIADSYTIRRTALQHKVTYVTTVAGAHAVILALKYGPHEQCYQLQTNHLRIGYGSSSNDA